MKNKKSKGIERQVCALFMNDEEWNEWGEHVDNVLNNNDLMSYYHTNLCAS